MAVGQAVVVRDNLTHFSPMETDPLPIDNSNNCAVEGFIHYVGPNTKRLFIQMQS
ncbi:hypothetical protein G9A89_007416 [Geosiphon pyriformis]|nr:hypothetical protein G9A89_007416 [Geosiphon pyriformis]